MQAACAPWGKLMAGAAGPNGRDLRMSDPLERQVEQLKETYWELAQEEGLGLGDFLERVQAGEWGQVAGEAIRRFLLDVEETMLANIEVKAQEGPPYSMMAEQAAEQTREMIEGYIAKYT